MAGSPVSFTLKDQNAPAGSYIFIEAHTYNGSDLITLADKDTGYRRHLKISQLASLETTPYSRQDDKCSLGRLSTENPAGAVTVQWGAPSGSRSTIPLHEGFTALYRKEKTRNQIEAMMRRAMNQGVPHAFEQFKLTETRTPLGMEYSLTLEPGQALTNVFDASNASFNLLANDEQKSYLKTVVKKGKLYKDSGARDPVTERTTIVVRPMIEGSTHKTLNQQMDSENGKLIFVDSEEVFGKPRSEIAAVAALKIVKSISEGIVVKPRKPEGDALEGKASRALGGGCVYLFYDGLCAGDWYDADANRFVGCAGSGSASRN